jgi:uncharacterized membrane protein
MFIQDLPYIGTWWFVFFTIGLINFPITWKVFRKFTGAGWGLSKILGVLLISYFTFLLSILHIAKFTNFTIYFILFLSIFFNIYLFIKKKKEIISDVKKNLTFILIQELLFLGGLLLWSYVRAHQPDIRGLEKFMDFGFVNSALRSDYLPPADMWFAGKGINYYWFGHFITALLTKLSRIPSEITYNLMLASIMGMILSAAFTIVSSLIKNISEKINKRTIIAAGIISAILLTFAGNFHTPYYILKDGADKYWYPDATRFIGYNPDVNDKTIHEFPIYSFVVADLHAHLINLPFVLLFIALLFKIVSEKEKKKFDLAGLTLAGFILGTFFMTSTWDFGNYLLASGVVLMLYVFIDRGFKISAVWDIGKALLIIIITGIAVSLPFILNFTSIAEGVKFVHSHTPLWQLAILWGFPAVLTLMFTRLLIKLKHNISTSDIFIAGLLITSWVLIAIPEVFYVKDIYTATHYRANTMFKLTYQAYVMFYLSSGYVTVRLISSTKDFYLKRFWVIFWGIIFYSILSYAQMSTNSYYSDLKTYHGLDGVSWMKIQYPGEYQAYNWLKENIKGQPVILEAPGDSYTDYNVISSYTGLPTVSGWFVHEWLWRGDPKFPQERVSDITTIYNSQDSGVVANLLKKYNVSYVIVGTFERQKFPYLNEAKFSQIGTLVFQSGYTSIYRIN